MISNSGVVQLAERGLIKKVEQQAVRLQSLNKKGCDECVTAQIKQGTGKDLAAVCRRTPRRQIANCIRGREDCAVHQECAPFFKIFITRQVYTVKSRSVKALRK